MNNSSRTAPEKISDIAYRFDSFCNGDVLHDKKKQHLPAMGWNSWNAFGSGNNEELTKQMADKIIELGLDKLGYKYLVLDDGCYLNERVDGRLANNPERFPSGFKALAEYIHGKGLKFGMYNDIGTNLCAGAAVGTCGHEKEDAESYVSWDVDFLKVDNCYYLWDNATFSDAKNAKYVFAPAIAGAVLTGGDGFEVKFGLPLAEPGMNPRLLHGQMMKHGNGIEIANIDERDYCVGIGTLDGTGPMHSPVGPLSGELTLGVDAPAMGTYCLTIDGLCGEEDGRGSWLQVAIDFGNEQRMFYDDLWNGEPIEVELQKGQNVIRLMNHRRQENTLVAYAKLLEGLNEAKPGHDIIYSMCEWGKTQPQNWAKKVGDSWRILNDITFDVGSDGRNGSCDWEGGYTNNVTAQYNKCVIMDEFAGLSKGWNDPDMMVIGMDKLNNVQYRTHMTMWCMMNSPLMLGLDLRRVNRGDALYEIIANGDALALNQDPLGVQAKRIRSSAVSENADTTYITNNDRVDILAKPLADGSVAISFINLSSENKSEGYRLNIADILNGIGSKWCSGDVLERFNSAKNYEVLNIWTGEKNVVSTHEFGIDSLEAYDNATFRIKPID